MIDIQDLNIESLTEEYHIPPKPEILTKLHGLMKNEPPDIRSIADLIAEDVGLSAEVLKTINSAFFGMRGQVSDIRQAAILLGPPGVANLVSALELRRSMTQDVCISLQRFWDCAADVARGCVLIGHHLDLRIPSEDLYTTGLFHDCGIVIMAAKHPEYMQVLIEVNSDYEHSMPQIEGNYYETDHTRMGYLITKEWGLPEVICQAILQNHERDIWTSCHDGQLKRIVAVLKLAENMADRHRRQCENPDWPHHRDSVLRMLDIDDAECKVLEQKFQES
ncbi:MAG: HDOD domain-containing protein [Pseudomonadota bacterium]